MLKFDEQNIGEAVKKIGKGIVDAMADSLAKTATEWIMRKNPLTAFKDGAQIVYDKIVDAFSSVGFGGAGETQFMPAGQTPFLPEAGDGDGDGEKKGLFSRAWTGLFGTKKTKAFTGSGTVGYDPDDPTDITKTRGNAPISDPIKERVGGVFGPMLTSFETLFNGFFEPGADWIGKLGEFFGGESSFLKGLGSLFTDFGGIFMDLLGSTKDGGSGLIGLVAGFFSPAAAAAEGAIFKGGFRKYARGGIATSPTIGLIGEGRYNEAVVPLPNGKAIPVDMRNSAQNNNITVNVSSDGQMQTEGGPDNEGLGRAIARAVQEELQNQKRAGGILNRYGTA